MRARMRGPARSGRRAAHRAARSSARESARRGRDRSRESHAWSCDTAGVGRLGLELERARAVVAVTVRRAEEIVQRAHLLAICTATIRSPNRLPRAAVHDLDPLEWTPRAEARRGAVGEVEIEVGDEH